MIPFSVTFDQVLALRKKLSETEAKSKVQITLLKKELSTLTARLDSALDPVDIISSKQHPSAVKLNESSLRALATIPSLRRDMKSISECIYKYKAESAVFIEERIRVFGSRQLNSSTFHVVISDSLRNVKQDWQTIRSNIELLKGVMRDCTIQLSKELIPEVEKHYAVKLKELRDQLQQETKNRRKLHNQLMDLKGNIRVFVRVRPLLEVELKAGVLESIRVPSESEIEVNRSGQTKMLTFDRVFDSSVPNSDLFSELYQLLVSALDGFNVCIMAYGITGSGKTFTMQGIYDRLAIDLFVEAATRQKVSGWYFQFTMSVYEVYNESIVDLLKIKNLDTGLKTNANTGMFHIPGLTKIRLDTPSELTRVLSEASRNRAVSSTNCNEQSSRSHLIVSIQVSVKTPSGKQMEAKISLVDLAGSERLDKSGATGVVAKEGMFINKSLSALGDVMNARLNKAAHVPYRNSILTSALQECIGGDSKTLMILQVSPSGDTADETFNSLIFGSRVREVESSKSPASPQKRSTLTNL